ncbi:restriction endonuclease subunit S [Limnohabitans sp. 15K]|uniref:restriction endonuclease subunit S n=1 Tax=Limnohabitans sp. 15K TaxID=1100706 RepID=UPI0013042FD0|nr:restriction endonuclease subunit S [Limnohabitans sp. 15K]
MSAELTAQEPSAKYLVNLQPPLVRHFDLIAQAPGGVARLRELILTLAVQGKLVPQDPNDEPASELLEKIRVEKDRLIAEGKIKRDKPFAEITDEEKPFELPTNWSWCKGREIFNVIRGVTYQKTDARETFVEEHLPLLRANNIQATINLDGLVYVPRHLVSDDQCLRKGDYLVCLASGSKKLVGKAAPFTSDVACTFGAFCGVIRPLSEMDFLAIYLSSPLYRDTVSAASAGIGINNLKGTSLLGLDIPLPPLAEQSRIVTRVEELMQLCDALEASGRLEAQQHTQLVNTLLGTLTQSESPEALADNWQRIATHFDVLLDRPEAVDALEQTILQLAVRGLLVPQDPTDEPASVLLQKIRTEKDHLIAQGKIKRDKPLLPITDEEKPFELPQGWEWVSLGLLTSFVTSGSRSWKDFYSAEGATFIRSQDIKYDRLEFDERAYVKLPIGTEGVRTQVRLHDVLITITGANVGKAAVVAQSMDEAYVSQHVALVRLCDTRLVDFLHLWLVSEGEGRKLLLMSSYGAKPGLNLQNINDLPVPLPPIAEQSRIVIHVNELRSLCADLRQRLAAGQTVQSHLADALVTG